MSAEEMGVEAAVEAVTESGGGVGSALSSFFGSKPMQNLGRSLTGNAVKAVLLIRDPEQALKENDKNQKNSEAELGGTMTDVNEINNELMKMAEKSLTGKGGSNTFSEVKKVADGKRYIAIEVQFNPNTLRFNTSAGLQTLYGEDATDQSMQTVNKPAATELYFELLFDDVNIHDAYMLEGNIVTNFNLSNAYQAAKSGITKLKGLLKKPGEGEEKKMDKFSVQRQMEGFMSLLTLDSARNVVFFWADMSFRGEVTAVQNTYTMFNKKGYPVRGKVGMTIRQGDSSGESDKLFQYQDTYWQHAFNRVFSDEIKKPSVNSRLSNNLINLKI